MSGATKSWATLPDFASFLDRLYAAVLEPDDWAETLAALAHGFSASAASIVVGQDSQHAPSLDLRWPANPTLVHAPIMMKHHDRQAAAQALASEAISERAGESFRSESALAAPAVRSSSGHPGQTFAARFEGGDGRWVQFLLRRDGEAPDFQPKENRSLRQLLPHIGRAALLTDRLMRVQRRSAKAEVLLDSLSSAVLIVDDRLRVLHLNQAGKVLLASQSALSTHDGQLLIASRERNLSLHMAVHTAIDQSRPQVVALKEASAGKPPLLATVVPLVQRTSRLQPGTAEAGTAAIILGTAFEGRTAALDLAAHIYELTPSEAEVLGLVADGLDSAAVAARLEIAVSTVRTHLHRLYDKTGTSRQPELIRLLHRYMPP